MITAVRAAKRSGVRGLVALAVTALALVGCGPYEAEPAMPTAYRVPPPDPPTAAELQARADARAAEAQAEGSAAASVGTGPEIAVGANADEYSDTDPSALTEFKPALSPYGTWVDDATYGTVWAPREDVVGADFEPYVTAGHWTYSDDTSWVWVSDYDWGWAPFHYGRWVRLPHRGWVWIPGRVYSGAWVVWRTGPVGYEYVGWAPAAPEWYWWNGVAVGWGFGWYHPHYVYCSHSYLYGPVVSTYVIRSGPAYVGIQERTQPYVPPNGGRVLAQPGVGGGRAIASPRVNGPRPDEIGMSANRITPPPSNHAGLMKAEAYATPRTAVAQGAAPPGGAAGGQSLAMQTRPRSTDALVSNAPSQSGIVSGGGAYRGYATGVSPSSRSLEPAARAPQVAGVAPTPVRPSSGGPLPEYRSRSIGTDAYAAPAPAYRPSSPSVSSAPSYRPSSPSISSAPSYRPSSPSVSTPSYRPSAPSISSTPSYRPSSPSVSAPAFRPSAPTVSSTPSYRPSSPSVSAPRSSGTRSSSGGATRGRR